MAVATLPLERPGEDEHENGRVRGLHHPPALAEDPAEPAVVASPRMCTASSIEYRSASQYTSTVTMTVTTTVQIGSVSSTAASTEAEITVP